VKETGAGGIGGATTGGAEATGLGARGGLGLGFGAAGTGVPVFGGVEVKVAVGVAAVVRGVDGRGSRLSGAGATAAMMGGSKGEEPPSWG
jgi:hypothetical protein